MELTPKEFQHIKRPCVRPRRSLYGHPQAGFDWDAKFKKVMASRGAQHLDNIFQSSYWCLLMTLYVDDMVWSGPRQVERLWTKIEEHLEIDPPTAADRILGRKHVYDHSDHHLYDMVDFCRSSCNLYVELSKRALTEASTPFAPDGASVSADWDEKGALSTCASRVLMKILWCARLARPDLIKPINDLTRKVTCWSVADDKRLFRLTCYLYTTPHLSLKSWIGDPFESLSLR